MGWLDTWYPNAQAAIGGLRGLGATGSDGVAMSLLTGTDTIGVLGQLSPAVVGAIKSFESKTAGDAFADRVVASDQLNIDGSIDNIGALSDSSNSITVEAYVAGFGDAGSAYRRSVIPGTATYEIFLASDEEDLFSLLRGAMESWQACCDASASAIESCGVDTSALVSTQSLATFWQCVRVLAGNLDQLNSNPPTSYADRIKESAIAALHKSETFAGEAAAALSHEVGNAAGNVAHGFFDTAGMTSVIVAGIAVFLYLR